MDNLTNDATLMNEVIEKLYQRCGEQELEEICSLLEKMYLTESGKVNRNFRHQYSGISGKMEELRYQSDNEENPLDLQNISTNINLLYEYAEKKKKTYLKFLFKLRDHICLEIGRIEYADKIYNNISSAKSELQLKIDDAISEVEGIEDGIKESKDTLENLENKIKQNQKESVAVLGIFAAIVLSFTGSFAFTSSVLENFQSGNIYRWLLVIILVGFVLINILYALFYFINRIIHGDQKRGVGPIIIPNLIIIGLLIVLVMVWNSGVIETVQKRNAEGFYNDEQQQSSASANELK